MLGFQHFKKIGKNIKRKKLRLFLKAKFVGYFISGEWERQKRVKGVKNGDGKRLDWGEEHSKMYR